MTESNRPEAELLLCCARTQVDPARAARIKALLHRSLDWNFLVREALRHGLAPLLYWHSTRLCPDTLPEEVLAQLRKLFDKNTWRNLFLTGELLTLLRLFKAQQIPAIPWKGPALAATIYRNLALRQFADLDVLVRRQDVRKATELLISLGYRPQFYLTRKQEAAFLRSQCQYTFVCDSKGVLVDLHWDITPLFFSFLLDTERLWERLEPISLAGTTVVNLVLEDLLLILCVHGAKHGWERLGWICDISELIRVHDDLDWDQVVAQAGALGSERMLFLGLFLVHDLLRTGIPQGVLKQAHADPMVTKLAQQVRRRFFQGTDSPPSYWESTLFHLRSRERLQDRLRYGIRQAVPTWGDWAFVSLPDSLFPLYYLLRPLRLAWKYSLATMRNADDRNNVR